MNALLKTRELLTTLLLLVTSTAALSALSIEGKIHHHRDAKVSINLLFGRFPLPMDDIPLHVNRDGSFQHEIAVQEIRFAQLSIGENQIWLFLSPEASVLKVTVEQQDIMGTLEFSGDTALENTFINQRPFPNYHEFLVTLSLDQKSSPGTIEYVTSSEEANEMILLNEIKDQISAANYEMLRDEIHYYYQTVQIQAGNNIGWRDPEAYEAHWRDRNQAIGKQLDCDRQNKFGLYYNHLIHTYYDHLKLSYYIDYPKDTTYWLAMFGVNNQSELDQLHRGDKYNIQHYVLGKAGFCPGVLEKVLSNRIYRSQLGKNFKNLILLFEGFQTLFPESRYLEQLRSGMQTVYEFEQTRGQAVEGINFFPKKAFEAGIMPLLKQGRYHDKVLLIDFWGTWCGPCRAEFPYVKAVKTALEKDNVVYIYLANEIQADPIPHWMETAKFYDLQGDHYLIGKDMVFQFLKDIDDYHPNFGYPTYMIVDRKGQVVNTDAADPSDGEELVRQIKEVLRQ